MIYIIILTELDSTLSLGSGSRLLASFVPQMLLHHLFWQWFQVVDGWIIFLLLVFFFSFCPRYFKMVLRFHYLHIFHCQLLLPGFFYYSIFSFFQSTLVVYRNSNFVWKWGHLGKKAVVVLSLWKCSTSWAFIFSLNFPLNCYCCFQRSIWPINYLALTL